MGMHKRVQSVVTRQFPIWASTKRSVQFPSIHNLTGDTASGSITAPMNYSTLSTTFPCCLRDLVEVP
jgi:hypothetical protein